jgi:outer membrane protein TolC
MRHNIILVLAIAVAATHVASAQQVKKLTLTEAIELGLKSSGRIRIANAKTDETHANLKEASERRLPDLKASGSYLRLNSPDVNLKANMGAGQGNEGQSGSTPVVNQLTYGMVTATFPVFSGFRIKCGIETAKLLEQASKFDGETEQQEVIETTVEAFANLYKAKRTVELVRENLQKEEARVKDFTNLEKNGLMARNDLLKAQLQKSNMELALMEAESNMKLASMYLALQLGMQQGTEIQPDTVGMEWMPDAGSELQWEQIAQEQRKDKAALNARIGAARMGLNAAKGEYWPAFALTGGYVGAYIPNFLTVANALNVGVGMQYNVGSLWKTSAKVEAAKAKLHQAEAMEGIASDQLRMEVARAYQTYTLSINKARVYAQTVVQADENYRITKNKYDNNLATTTDLLDADVAQLQARLNFAFSKADAMVAYKKLQKSAGVLSVGTERNVEAGN